MKVALLALVMDWELALAAPNRWYIKRRCMSFIYYEQSVKADRICRIGKLTLGSFVLGLSLGEAEGLNVVGLFVGLRDGLLVNGDALGVNVGCLVVGATDGTFDLETEGNSE